MRSIPSLLHAGLLALLSLQVVAQQAPLFEETRTLSSVVDPVESAQFVVTQAGTYEIVLTDLGAARTPAAPMAAIQMAVMSGATVTNAFTSAGTRQVSLNAGTYRVRVAGEVGANSGSGFFQVTVRSTAGAQFLLNFSSVLTRLSAATASTVRVLEADVSIPVPGNYVAEITDLNFPALLVNASLFLALPSPALPVILDLPGSPAATTRSATFSTTAAGTYQLFALAEANTTAGSGALAVRIRNTATNAVVYGTIVAVGRVAPVASGVLAAGPSQLVVADLAFPANLQQFGVLVIRNAAEVARSATAGTTQFAVADAGEHGVYAYGTAGSTAAGGSLAVDVGAVSAASAISTVLPVGKVYAFPVTVAAPGNHTARLTDQQFPAALNSAGLALVQAGVVKQSRSGAGTISAQLGAGAATVLVRAEPATAGGLQQSASLVSVSLADANGGSVLDTTQGVGGLFSSRQFTVTNVADLRITAEDLQFPAQFAEFAAAVTRGSERLGLVFGAGSFDIAQAAPGVYSINFLARPDATLKAGTYHLVAAPKPPSPVITFTASPAAPDVGGTTTLTWSVQNATSCQASGGWSGSKALTGSETTGALSVTTTFTLTCTGIGGTTAVDRVVTPLQVSNSGGGGSTGWLALMALSLLLAYRHRYGPV
jgi:hypothetical protein